MPLPRSSARLKTSTFSISTIARFARRAHPAEAQKFGAQTPQVRIVRLREALDFGVGDRIAKHAAQIVEDDAAAERQQPKDEPAGPRNLSRIAAGRAQPRLR